MVNGPNPESSIGWLDANAEAQERVAEMLRAFDEPGTVDSLGIGTIRDTLADALAPGVSTIQTRLRYFLFIPWIFQHLEGWPKSTTPFASRLRNAEAKLIRQLKHLGAGQGVIGRQSGKDLKRMPSSIYWAGLRTWGIRLPIGGSDLSIARTGELIHSGANSATGDYDEASSGRQGFWVEMPRSPAGFFEEDSEHTLELTDAEAEWLLERLRHTPETSGSFLRVAADHARGGASKAELDSWWLPWESPASIRENLKPEHANLLRHAKCFSTVIWGPQLLYRLLLADRASSGTEADEARERADAVRNELLEWAGEVASLGSELRDWCAQIDEFWGLIAHLGGSVFPPTRMFANAAIATAIDDPAGLADNSKVRDLVQKHEVTLKGKVALLGSQEGPLADWVGKGMPARGQPLDYRWDIVQRYLHDIAGAGSEAD